MLTVLNQNQMSFGKNWLHFVKRAKIDYAIVGAADQNMLDELPRWGVPCFPFIDSDIPGLGLAWGEEGWRRMTWQKVFALKRALDLLLLDREISFIVSDVDVVWLKDPLPLMKLYPEADILFGHDGVWTYNPADAAPSFLEFRGNAHTAFNTGAYFIKNTESSSMLVHEWVNAYNESKAHDQDTLYLILRRGDYDGHPEVQGLTHAFNGTLWLGILNTVTIGNGHSYSVSQQYKDFNDTHAPYAVHFTWVYDGQLGKTWRMRDADLWMSDDDEWYTGPEAGYISIDLCPPPPLPEGYNDWLADRTEDMILLHLEELQRQLEQIYVGLALAAATKRALILPKMHCFCEYIWYPPTRCRNADAQDMKFPVTCPADYIFELDAFYDEAGGPLIIPIREWNFLAKTKVRKETKMSRIRIVPTLGATEAVVSQTSDSEVATVPALLHDDELLPLLHALKDRKVWTLDFSGVVNEPLEAYQGFACESKSQGLERRVSRVVKQWCCRFEDVAKELGKPVKEALTLGKGGRTLQPKPNALCFEE